jgi:hypothetical protein
MSNFISIFDRNQAIFIDNPMSDICQNHNELHYSVDYYIGTGSQFLAMQGEFEKAGKRFNITDIGVLCIQEEAKALLENQGYEVIGLDVRGKAIEQLAAQRGVTTSELYEVYTGSH